MNLKMLEIKFIPGISTDVIELALYFEILFHVYAENSV